MGFQPFRSNSLSESFSKDTYNNKSHLVDVAAFLRGLVKDLNGILAFVSRIKVASISSYAEERIKIKWDWNASN